MKKLTRNRAQCSECEKIIESTHRHDFVTCDCEEFIFIDGGLDYIRTGGALEKFIPLFEYEEVQE